MRVLIAEEALQTGSGHWPSYIGGIAEGFRAEGDEVDVLAHREASPAVIASVGATPWFERNCWRDPRSQGPVGGIRHNLRFRFALNAWLKAHQPYDWVCALTMRLQHLLAFALLSRDSAIPRTTRFLLLFVQGFGQFAGPGVPTTFSRSSSNQLARLCFRLLAPAVRSGRVVLAAETAGMQDELTRFTSLPVALFPHPIPPASPQSRHPSSSGNSVTITCPGFARHEKGNDLLQEAILDLLSNSKSAPLRFILQWPEPFTLPDGSQARPDPILLKDSRVEFLNGNLDSIAYEHLLARTDIVVLPYRRASYHHRVSRVAIEAASRGIPLVYTQGTWTAEIAELAGCGVPIENEDAISTAKALTYATNQLLTLQHTAQAGATNVTSFHSVQHFRSLLLDTLNS